MIVSLSNTQAYGYPEVTEDPRKKTPEYIAAYGRAFFSDFMRKPENQNWYHGRDRYIENEKYSLGEQDMERYKGMFNHNPENNRRPWEKLKLKHLKILPRYFRNMQAKLNEVQFDAICTPIDSRARQQKEEYAATLRFAMERQEWMKSMGIDPSVATPDGTPDIPIDEDEFQQRMDTFQNQEAMDMEVKIAVTMNENDWEQLDREFDQDIRDYGANVFEDYTYQGRHYVKRIEPKRAFIPFSPYSDHRDMVHAGYLKTLTIAELREELRGEFPEGEREQKLQAILDAIPKRSDYYNVNPSLGREHDNNTVEVFYFQFKSKDQYVARKSKSGIIRERKFDYQPERLESGAEVKRVPYNCVYEGHLILGTDHAYGCRKAFMQKRDMQKPSDCLLNIHAFIPNMRQGKAVPLVEEVMGIVDAIYRDWIGMHDDIAKSVPEGWAYDFDALDNIVLQSGGKIMSKGELMNIHQATGNIYYRGTKIDGITPINSKGIEPANGGGLPASLMTRIELIRSNIAMIEQITGINNITAGTNVNPEMGARTSEIAIQGSVSSLEHFFWAKNKRFEAMCKSLAIRVRSGEKYRPVTGTIKRPNGQYASVEANPNIDQYVYDIKIENRPSEKDWEEFYLDARQSLANKEITIADMAAIRIVPNLKGAYYMLASRVKRTEAKRQQEAMMLQQQNGEIQMQSAQSAEQSKQATLQMKSELDLQSKTQLINLEMERDKLRYAHEMAVAQLQAQAQIQGKQVQGDNDIKTATVKGEVETVKIETQAALAPKEKETEAAEA